MNAVSTFPRLECFDGNEGRMVDSGLSVPSMTQLDGVDCSSPEPTTSRPMAWAPCITNTPFKSFSMPNFERGVDSFSALSLPSFDSPETSSPTILPRSRHPSPNSTFDLDSPMPLEIPSPSVAPKFRLQPRPHQDDSPLLQNPSTFFDSRVQGSPKPKRARLVSFVSLDRDVHMQRQGVFEGGQYHPTLSMGRSSAGDWLESCVEEHQVEVEVLSMPRVFRPTIPRAKEPTIVHSRVSFSPSTRSAFSQSRKRARSSLS